MSTRYLRTPVYIAVALTLALSGMLGGCQKHEKTRVKLEVVVDDNGKTYRGSSVQQYSCRQSTQIMSDSANCYITGEAVVVKIGDKGDLFMVFDKPGARNQTTMVWSVLGAVSDSPMTENNATLPKTWSLRPDQMPLMVRFSDPADAYSVQAVDPAHLDVSFGTGVKLIAVNVSTTSNAVTFGTIRGKLPWIDTVGVFQHNTGRNQLAEGLGGTTFIQGEKQ